MSTMTSFNQWIESKMSNNQTRKEFLESRWGDDSEKVMNDIFWAYCAGYSNRVIEARYKEV